MLRFSGLQEGRIARLNLGKPSELMAVTSRALGYEQLDEFRGFQIDDELKLRRLLHRQVGGLGAFKDLVYIACGAPLGRTPLDSAKNFDTEHPAMDQVGRLLERFSMDYCKFLQTQDEAIEHCRLVNRGLRPTDPGCCAVVVGPEDNNYAVVDLQTAKDLLDDGDSGLTCLVVTD